jgi:hypothetical protein
VFKISRESALSDTARASDIAPTSALKVEIALDLPARLSLPGSNPVQRRHRVNIDVAFLHSPETVPDGVVLFLRLPMRLQI